MQRHKTVESFIDANPDWRALLNTLREALLNANFEETVKWGVPTYCLDNKNLIGIGVFKEHLGLWFHQGSFLKDKHKVLINAQEGKTKGLRQWRFGPGDEVPESILLQFIEETIANHKAGKEIKADTSKPVAIPPELQAVLDKDTDLTAKFAGFGKGKQREFAEHISSAKREATKQSRLEKIIPMIKGGIGLNDKYR